MLSITATGIRLNMEITEGKEVKISNYAGKLVVSFPSIENETINIVEEFVREQEPNVIDDVPNVIDAEEDNVPEENNVEEPNDVQDSNNQPIRRLWSNAQPGSFFYNIDCIINKKYNMSNQFTNDECWMLMELKQLNSSTFRRAVDIINLSPKERKNLLAKIWRKANPEKVRTNSARQYLRRIALRK